MVRERERDTTYLPGKSRLGCPPLSRSRPKHSAFYISNKTEVKDKKALHTRSAKTSLGVVYLFSKWVTEADQIG